MADTSVDWNLARQVATKVSERNDSVSSYHYATLAPDFERFTAQAEELVAETTGLKSDMGNAIKATEVNGLGVVPARMALANAEYELANFGRPYLMVF